MAQVNALIAVVLVVLEVAVSVMVNFATNGSSPWLWPLLGLVVVVTCTLVWWRHRRSVSGRSTRARIKASVGGEVEDSPVSVPARGDVEMSIKASWWGKVRRSGITGRR
ncbi:hypothetical protein [Frankia sp. CiP3]|uniref:hypothetical protein n=1 Tax=Frankia sp. CiP3 TaxID=2880971 RepID=UPI001EF66929|nr:hypothetical protein [Frankia sp. CiP3]